MNALERQRARRARLQAELDATRAARAADYPPAVHVVRMSGPPLPETVAYVRAKYGPHAVIVVEATP